MDKLSRIFKEMGQIEPSTEMGSLIMQKIELEKSRQARRKLIFSYVGLTASFVAIFPAILKFGADLLRSEFWTIFSLAFSDFMVVAASWREYLYSLGETLPILSIVAVLIPVFGILMFLNLHFSVKEKMKNSHVGRLRFKLV